MLIRQFLFCSSQLWKIISQTVFDYWTIKIMKKYEQSKMYQSKLQVVYLLRLLPNEIWLQMQTLKKMGSKRPTDTYLCCICFKRQHECFCESFRKQKKHFWKKSVVNVFNEVANTTLRVQRRILSKVRMPRVHTLFNVVSLPRTLKNIMSKSLEPHLVDCLDITCTSCRCAVCGQYKEQCSDPSHPKWNEDIFLKPTKKL